MGSFMFEKSKSYGILCRCTAKSWCWSCPFQFARYEFDFHLIMFNFFIYKLGICSLRKWGKGKIYKYIYIYKIIMGPTIIMEKILQEILSLN